MDGSFGSYLESQPDSVCMNRGRTHPRLWARVEGKDSLAEAASPPK